MNPRAHWESSIATTGELCHLELVCLNFVFISDFVSVFKWVFPLEGCLGGIPKENEEMSLLHTLNPPPGGPGSCCGPGSSGGINATPKLHAGCGRGRSDCPTLV